MQTLLELTPKIQSEQVGNKKKFKDEFFEEAAKAPATKPGLKKNDVSTNYYKRIGWRDLRETTTIPLELVWHLFRSTVKFIRSSTAATSSSRHHLA